MLHQHQQMGLNAFPLSSLKYTLVEDLLHTWKGLVAPLRGTEPQYLKQKFSLGEVEGN